MLLDRVSYEGEPVGKVAPPTAAQEALMHRSFTQQEALCDRMGESKDAARWRKLADDVRTSSMEREPDGE